MRRVAPFVGDAGRSAKVGQMPKGLIFNIQRFSIHDGPGIRTTVFMKGCPLRCPWCSNPESQDNFPNLMVRDLKCLGCGACVEACPQRAITFSEEAGRRIDWSKCNQCLACAGACIYGSLNICGRYAGVPEVVDEIMADADFYRNSGGGMTVSGGEALMQADFVKAMLQACRERGLHTALDTTGFSPWETLRGVLEFTDLVLFDIKHLDPLTHREATGVGNKRILKNLLTLAKGKRLWLRMPVIPGYNDTEEHVLEVAALGKSAGAEKISLLPYHEGGKAKSGQLGRVYLYSEAKPPRDEHMQRLKKLMVSHGVHVSIGS